MINRDELVAYLNELLKAEQAMEDSSNNGLQVEGGKDVRLVVFAVDASLALFEHAIAAGADFLFVHHGLSWRDNLRYLTGATARRVRALLANGISLYASHLPLDAHPTVGHNAVIAALLALRKRQPFYKYGGAEIGWCGEFRLPQSTTTLVARISDILGVPADDVTVLPKEFRQVRTVGVVSGAGADAVGACAELGLDALVTGEVGHAQYHTVLESGVSVLAAGHYRSEVPGVKTVMERVADRFDVACRFFDLPTGM